MIRSEALKIYAEAFKKLGFKKYGNTWFQKHDELTVIFNVQNSNFSAENYFINVGVALNCEITGRYPKSGNWLRTLNFRLESYDYNDGLGITPDEREVNLKKLSFEELKQIANAIMQPDPYIILEKAIPLFEKMSTVDKLFNFIRTAPECKDDLRPEDKIEKIRARLRK